MAKVMRAKRQCAQGDVFFRRVDRVPDGFRPVAQTGKEIVIAHSETGHHHVVDAQGVVQYASSDPMVCYLQLESVSHVDARHLRPWDTHDTLRLLGGPGSVWEIRRQREETPAGWRQVQD